MSAADQGSPDIERLESLQQMEDLAETLHDRPAGDLFRVDLDEARLMAQHDPRFAALATGLEAETLGGRLGAIDRFFAVIPAAELAALALPPNLSQLRSIYLSSKT